MINRERFGEILETKGLSDATKSAYLYYYDSFQTILSGIERDLDQSVIDAFLITFKNASPCRAFLKIYLEEEGRTDLKIPILSGRKAVKKRQYLAPSEIKAIGDLMKNKGRERFFLMFYVTYECALRRKETTHIKAEDFNWTQWLEDPEKKGRLKISVEGAKGKKERIVLVPSWLMKRVFVYVKDNLEKFDDEDPLFQVGNVRWHQIFKKYSNDAIKRKCSLHDLRFSRATEWYKQGVDIRRIKIRLGHSRIETTFKYINPDEEEELEAWQHEG